MDAGIAHVDPATADEQRVDEHRADERDESTHLVVADDAHSKSGTQRRATVERRIATTAVTVDRPGRDVALAHRLVAHAHPGATDRDRDRTAHDPHGSPLDIDGPAPDADDPADDRTSGDERSHLSTAAGEVDLGASGLGLRRRPVDRDLRGQALSPDLVSRSEQE